MSDDRQVLNKANMGIADGLPLQASAGGIEELRGDVQRLMDMEAIKKLKHAYFRCIDTANMEELATLFGSLGKADSRVEQQVLGRNSGIKRGRCGCSEFVCDFTEQESIVAMLLHIGGIAAHMHQRERCLVSRAACSHFRVA